MSHIYCRWHRTRGSAGRNRGGGDRGTDPNDGGGGFRPEDLPRRASRVFPLEHRGGFFPERPARGRDVFPINE